MLKKRIISIILCAVMVAGEFSFTAFAASGDYRNVDFVVPLEVALPVVGNSGFIKQPSGEMPEMGSDGFILTPEEELPALDADKEGFVREPEVELPAVEQDGFVVEPSEEMPTQREDGFIKEPEIPLPEAREDGFISAPGKELPTAGSDGFISSHDGYVFNGKEKGFLKAISEPDPSATVISTAEELAAMTSGSYVLANDINLEAYNGGEWIPVEPKGDIVFDGAGHKIINMSATAGTYEKCSLFITYNYASDADKYDITVKNVGFERTNSSTIGNSEYGGAAIIYNFNGDELVVDNCYNTVPVVGGAGLIGYVMGTSVTVTNSYNTGSVTGSGGIIGSVQSGSVTLSGCFNSGAVKNSFSDAEVGGIIGAVQFSKDSEYTADITNCSNFGRVTSDNIGGGIIGEFAENSYAESRTAVTIENCSNTGMVSGAYASAGIIGYSSADELEITNCFSTGRITLSSEQIEIYCGGIAGYTGNSADISKCYNKGQIILTCTDKENDSYYTYCCAAGILAFSEKPSTVTDCFNAGMITGTAHYGLYTAGIAGYGECTINRSYNTANITANDTGTITITPSKFFAAGISAYASVNISNSYNTGKINSFESAAGITTYANSGKYTNCFNTGEIKGIDAAGIAVMPRNYSQQETPTAVFEACINSGTVTATEMASGIVYSNNSTNIEAISCINEGAVTAMTAAGIVKIDDIFTDDHEVFKVVSCLNTGAVTGEYDCAGILSEETVRDEMYTQTTFITDCMNTGVITWGNGLLTCTVGVIRNSVNAGEIINGSGLFSSMYGSVYDSCNTANVTGGCGLGYNLMSEEEAPSWVEMDENLEWVTVTVTFDDAVTGELIGCFNTGTIIGSAGLLMNAGSLTVERCYNTGSVDTTDAFSGAAGLILTVNAAGSFSVADSYNTGNLVSTAYMFDGEAMGGIIGYLGVATNAYVENCYNTGNLTHSESSGNTVIGGLVGTISVSEYANFYNQTITNARIADCYNSGSITATGESYTIGGILGLNHDISGSGTILCCASLGDITFTSGVAGGIAGDCDMDAKYCIATGAYEATAKTADTVVVGVFKRGCDIISCRLDNIENVYTHAIFALTCGNIDNCYYKTALEGSYHSGALAGECGNITDSYYIGNIALDGETSYFGGLAGKAQAINNSFFVGDIDVATSVEIVNFGGLAGECTDVLASVYSGNMTCSTSHVYGKVKLGGIAGKADSVKRSQSFGSAYSSSNLCLGGGLAGYAMTAMNSKSQMDLEINTVQNNNVLEGVTEHGAAGGIIGDGAVVIYNCTNTGDITSSLCAGGIAGYSEDVNISSCANTGDIETTDNRYSQYTGGICGFSNTANIRDCVNFGTVTAAPIGEDYSVEAGGIVGNVYYGSITRCSNHGDVQGDRAAGITFDMLVTTFYGDIVDCVNHGTITSQTYNAYGIGNADVDNCVNHGTISGITAMGIGLDDASYCLNDGTVSGQRVYGICASEAVNCINKGTLYAENITSSDFDFLAVAIGETAERCVNEGVIYCDNSSATGAEIYGICTGKAIDCYNNGDIDIYNISETSAAQIFGIGVSAENCVNDGKIGFSSAGSVTVYGISRNFAVNCKNNAPITVNTDYISLSDDSLYQSSTVYGISYEANKCYNYGDITVKTTHTLGSDQVYGIGRDTSYCENHGDISIDANRTAEAYGVGRTAIECENSGYIDVSGTKANASGVALSAKYCTNSGTVSAKGDKAYAGGIAATSGSIVDEETLTNCENTASVSATGVTAAYAGGIMGYGSDSFANCTNSGKITAYCSGSTEENAHSDAGGIIGFASGDTESYWGIMFDSDRMVIENCYNSGTIDATALCSGSNLKASAHAGGLIGDMTKSVMMTNFGNDVYSYCVMFVDDASFNTGKISVYSSTPDSYEENVVPCELKGDIFGHGQIRTGANAYPDTVYLSGENLVEIGKTIKISSHLIPSDVFFGGVSWSSSDASIAKITAYDEETVTITGIAEGRAIISATTQNGLVAKHIVDVLDNRITVTVKGYERFKEAEAYPLEGASVTIGGVTQTTDDEGKAVFERGDLPQGSSASLFISAGEDYSEEDTIIGIVPSSYSTNHTYYLREKDYTIIVDSATVTIDHVRYSLVNAPGMKYIPYLENDGTVSTDKYPFNVKIDWGKYEDNVGDRKVWLESATAKIQIKEGDNSVAFAEYFQPKEAIKVVATTKNSAGETVKGEYTLPLKTQIINVNLTPQPSENFDLGPIYFLNGLDLKLSMENLGHAADFELKDGVLKLEFGGQKKADVTKNIDLGLFENKNESKVSVSGFVSIPVNDPLKGEWEGGVKVAAGVTSTTTTDREKGKNGFELFAHKHEFYIGAVPVFIDVELRGGGSGQLSLFGPFDKVYFRGKLEGVAEAEIFGGIGKEVFDDCQMKFGPSGTLKATVPMTFEAKSLEDTTFSFDPSVEGELDLKLFVKLFDVVEIDESLDIGRFKLDKNGFVKNLDKQKSALMLLGEIDYINSPIKVIGREYLANGGGFNGATASVFSRSAGGRVINTVYENIIACADAELTIINGNPVLVFSMDNTERDTYNALNAVYSVYNNGVWSNPVSIEDDGTIDSGMSASGGFIVWEDTNGTVNSSNTLSEALAMTDISVAVWDGEKFVTQALTNDGVYDFGAKIKDYDGKAIAAWLSNTEVDCTSNAGETSVCYSLYDGTAWSEVKTAANVGKVTNVNVLYNQTGAYVVYKDATLGLKRINAQTGETDTYFENVGRYVVADTGYGMVLADIDSENKLNIYVDGNLVKTVSTNFNGSANPVIGVNGQYANVFWTENDGIYYVNGTDGKWSDKLCFKQDTASVSNLDCVLDENGEFVLTYMRTEEEKTNLVTVTAALGADLVVEQIGYDSEVYTGENRFDYSITLKNNGEDTVNGCSVYLYDNNTEISVLDFEDTVIQPGESVELTGSSQLAEDVKSSKHTFTLEATCGGDFDMSNNSLTIDVGTVDAELLDATFEVNEVGEESLVIKVRNNGDVDIDSTTVTVCKNSKNSTPIYTFGTGSVPVGETGEFKVPEKQDETAIYYVTVSVSGDENDSNDMECVAYERIDQNPPVRYDYETGNATATVDSEAAGDDGNVVAVLYSEDMRLKEIDITDVVAQQTEYTVELPGAKAGDIIQIMVLGDLDSISPKMPAISWTVE